MSRYTEIDEVKRLIVETGNRHSRNGEDIHTCDSICADLVISVYQLPIADVQEVRHGRWIDVEHAPNGLLYATCSVCGKRQTIEATNYCGNCGSFNGKDNLNEKL